VRSDWKNRGVGWALMTRLIAVARQRGLGRLTAPVLRENERMLAFCRDLGFTAAFNPDDAETVRVTLALDQR